MSARAISATFSTWRPVMGRKVLQLIFEVPIEKQAEVLTMLGAPDDKWCAIALLKEQPKGGDDHRPERGTTITPPQAEPVATPGARSKVIRSFKDLSLPEQAGIRCDDKAFVAFIRQRTPQEWWEIANQDAASVLRGMLGIQSRAELSTNRDAGNDWRALERDFQNHLADLKYAGSRR